MKKKTNYQPIFIFVFILGITAWGFSDLLFPSGPSEKEKQEIMATGTKATAKLLSISRAGTIVNSIHQYEFVLGVSTDSIAEFTVSRKKLVDPIYTGSIKIGMKIPAYVSLDGEKKVVILWEKVGLGDAF